jgi:HD superfamily phosphohydrolase
METKRKAIIYKDDEGYWGEILNSPGFLCYGINKEDVTKQIKEKYNVTPEDRGNSLFIRDPIYNYVEIDAPLIPIINPISRNYKALFLQRLRYIKQNGLAYLVYPSVNTTRFEHSIGTMQLAKKVIDSIFVNSNSQEIKQFTEGVIKQLVSYRIFDNLTFENSNKIVLIRKILKFISCYLALFHDIGQLPFSHTLEAAIEEFLEYSHSHYKVEQKKIPSAKYHELFSLEIIAETNLFHSKNYKTATLLCLLSDSKISAISRNLKNSAFATMKEIVNSQVDIDRGDFTQRDGYMSGASFGILDIERVVRSFRLYKKGDKHIISFDSKGLRAVESLLVERYKVYKTLAYHHKVIFFNLILKELFKEMLEKELFTKLFVENVNRDSNCNLKELNGPFLTIKNEKNGKSFCFRPRFFIHPENNLWYFDDAYILKKISKEIKNKDDQKGMYADIILNRRPYCYSLWKGEKDFLEIRTKTLQTIAKNITKLKLTSPVDDKDLNKFLIKIREEKNKKHMFLLFKKFCEIFESVLKARIGEDVKVLITYSDPSIFGNISDIQIMNSSGSSQSITKLSKMLDVVNNLPNEIGYYIYVVSREIPKLKQKKFDNIEEFIIEKLEYALEKVIKDFIIDKTGKFEELVKSKN